MSGIKNAIVKEAPTILSSVAAIGVVTVVIFARRDTIKAEVALEKAYRDIKGIDYDMFKQAKRMSKKMDTNEIASELNVNEEYIEDILEEDLEPKEKAIIYAKNYIPTVVVTIATLVCIFSSNHISKKRIAALASAYVLSETTLKEYKEKLKEVVGETKASEIEEKIFSDKIKNNPDTVSNTENIGMSNNVSLGLWYDTLSDRYFYSNAEKIRRAELDAQRILDKDGSLTLNDAYDLLGLKDIPIGDFLGWECGKPNDSTAITFKIGYGCTDDERPVGTLTILDLYPRNEWFSSAS